jgi:hypothetical protein
MSVGLGKHGSFEKVSDSKGSGPDRKRKKGGNCQSLTHANRKLSGGVEMAREKRTAPV